MTGLASYTRVAQHLSCGGSYSEPTIILGEPVRVRSATWENMTEMAQWFGAARRVVPGGVHLRDNDWTLRHRGVGAMAFAASVALAVGVGLAGAPLVSALLCGGVPMALAVTGWLTPAGRRLRASLGSAALIVATVIAVHLSGAVESQFLLFIFLCPFIAL